ncbi:MAG: LapA family protein [Betaproteobacteria bacterium]|nr:LapA family protein [Betaproteobacteria bacterium]
MRAFTWVLILPVFLFLLVFATKNSQEVDLFFFFGMAWKAPMVIVLFASFVAGVAFGMVALFGTLFRQRRELSKLRKQQRQQETGKTPALPDNTPPPSEFA